MATIINTPSPSTDSGNGIGMVIGVIVLVAVLYSFFVYGIPAMRNIGGTPQINVPSKIDVNINK